LLDPPCGFSNGGEIESVFAEVASVVGRIICWGVVCAVDLLEMEESTIFRKGIRGYSLKVMTLIAGISCEVVALSK